MTDAQPEPRAKRIALSGLIVLFFGVAAVLCFVAQKFEAVYEQLEMKSLPAPTEAFIALAGFVRSPVGLVVWILAAAGMAALVLRGACDARLKALTIATLLGTFGFVWLFVIGVYMPIIKIQESLSR